MGKTLIRVKCVDQRLFVSETPIIASGGRNEDEVEFNFCPLWDGFEKVAVFHRDRSDAYHAVISENRCVIPHEVLKSDGLIYFGVFGVKEDITRTSEVAKYRIVKGAITEGTNPSDPTPDIYAQYVERINRLEMFVTGSDPYTITGNPVQLENFEGMPMDVVQTFNPIQSGSGDPYPAGGGRNLISFKELRGYNNTIFSASVIDGQSVTTIDVSTSDYAWASCGTGSIRLPAAGTYTFSAYVYAPATATCRLSILNSTYAGIASAEQKLSAGWTRLHVVFADASANDEYMFVVRALTSENVDISFNRCMVELGDVPTEYQPYSNIRPISGYDSLELALADKTENKNTYTVHLGDTVYGGTYDWSKGELVVNMALMTLNSAVSSEWTYVTDYGSASRFNFNNNAVQPASKAVCNTFASVSVGTPDTEGIAVHGSQRQIILQIKTNRLASKDAAGLSAWLAENPLQIAYKLATPITIQLTPQQITALQGVNTLYSDVGEMTVSGRKDILWLTSYLLKQNAELTNAIISLGGNV